MIEKEEVKKFLEGENDEKYITNIEVSSYDEEAFVFYNDPYQGKYIRKENFQPFLWMKPQLFKDEVYSHDKQTMEEQRKEIIDKSKEYNIEFITLDVESDDGFSPDRMKNGYTVLVKTEGKFKDIIDFFASSPMNVNIYEEPYKDYFIKVKPNEQFMIQTGKRLFKGFDQYDQIQRFYFDLETDGIDPNQNRIFQIGIRDSHGHDGNGFEEIIEVHGSTQQELRDNEREAILKFFRRIDEFNPDIIAGYNSEDFDWPFIRGRCEYLKIDLYNDIADQFSNSPKRKYLRKFDNTLKVGGETEKYEQTNIWGYNILDICHPVRKAKAANSDIKGWSLKYITKFSKANKPNRVYVQGDKIYDTWADTESTYAFNEENGDWYLIDNDNEIKEGYEAVSGQYIIDRYLKDDLWETEKVDNIYSQAAFLIGKLLPTSYMRNCTMGTSGTWQLIMQTWSYKNNLAIPSFEGDKDFPGGLSRMFQIGRAEDVIKYDYSALYPRTQLTFEIFPELDISGIMKNLLEYIVNTRDEAKGLKGDYGKEADKLEDYLEENEKELTTDKINELKQKIEEYKNLKDFYDKKQMPLKILANSFFGSFGSPRYFPWAKTACAGETTCRGRQFLRVLANFFYNRGYTPLICDTDGMNFSMPKDVNEHTYIPEGTHQETKNDKGKELTGFDADVAEFNEKYMVGYMALDVDEVAEAEINFSKKNYATLIDGEVKKTGNTLKADTLETYISEFIDEGLELLLHGKGKEFIEKYYSLVEDIYNYRVPISKIASKGKVKMTKEDYRAFRNQVQKNGRPQGKQAWMELVLHYDMNVNLGDVIYYYNSGTAKSHGDVSTQKDAKTGEKTVKLNCDVVDNQTMENYPDTIIEDYNVPLYINKLNERVKPLLVCFSPQIRDDILISVEKDKKTKEYVLQERREFTKKECEMVTGYPLKGKEDQQDDYYEDFIKMEDKEIDFWMNEIQKVPNNMGEEEWEDIKNDYIERKEREKEADIVYDEKLIDDYAHMSEIDEIEYMRDEMDLSDRFKAYFHLNDKGDIICNKWNIKIGEFGDVFKYEEEAKERSKFYESYPEFVKKYKSAYDAWLVHKTKQRLNGHMHKEFPFNEDVIVDELKMKSNNISLIKSGDKKATCRTKKLKNGFYRLEDGTIVELDGYYYSNISEMKDPESWAKAEGFDSLEDMKKNCYYTHTRSFIKGKRGLYIYKINKVFPN